jgi:pimeloyl-ACP methyl ester carboxylesterase
VPSFKTFDGLEISYREQGTGPPVLLLHGFAANAQMNWVAPGIFGAVVDAGFRAIAPDARGHGESGRPHDPAAYEDDAMARDVSALLDHLALERVAAVGYSMGAMTTWISAARDSRIHAAVLGGIGGNLVKPPSDGAMDRGAIADALEAGDGDAAESPVARAFRRFAESTGADLKALAAVQRANHSRRMPEGKLEIPILVVVGKEDVLAGGAEPLAAAHARARAVTVPGDHLSAVGEPALLDAIVSFLREVHGTAL